MARRSFPALDSRMRRFPLSVAVFLTSLSCQAGYYEYKFLAPAACEAFSISSDVVPPDVDSPRASLEYKAYVSANGPDTSSFWALYDGRESLDRWADCRYTEKEIACTVIGPFRYPSFTCPLGQSKEWSRSCTTTGGKVGELKIYSEDTREYELGGKPIVNRYLQTDREKFETRCHKAATRR